MRSSVDSITPLSPWLCHCDDGYDENGDKQSPGELSWREHLHYQNADSNGKRLYHKRKESGTAILVHIPSSDKAMTHICAETFQKKKRKCKIAGWGSKKEIPLLVDNEQQCDCNEMKWNERGRDWSTLHHLTVWREFPRTNMFFQRILLSDKLTHVKCFRQGHCLRKIDLLLQIREFPYIPRWSWHFCGQRRTCAALRNRHHVDA